jgi:MoaA/NifB/PqqE/SkfB family radical SAM enzyme
MNNYTFPKVFALDNANFCNLRCSMCDYKNVHKYRKKQKLNIDLYKKIIDEIALEDKTVRVWEIFFGEPCLCKDMPNRLSYAKDKGLTDIVLNSNGMLLSDKISIEYIRSGLDVLYVGVDAISDIVYKQMRVGGDLETVINNILTYKENLIKYGNGNQKLFVQFIECSENMHEKEQFISFWKSNDVNVKIRPKMSWAGLVSSDKLNSNINRVPCYWAMDVMAICSDGTVALCAVDLHRKVNCGDISKNSIKEIWNEGILQKYRSCHLNGSFSNLPELCQTCMDWQAAKREYK